MFKSAVWLDYEKVQNMIDISYDELVKKLKSVYETRGGRKRVLLRDNQYFLHKDYVDEFINKFNLVGLKNVPAQDANWVPVARLSGLCRMMVPELVRVARKLKNDVDMCDNNGMPLIQFRRTAHGRNTALCLFNSDMARLKLMQKLGIKTNRFGKPVPYKMQYDWSEKRNFSDDEIDKKTASLDIEKALDILSQEERQIVITFSDNEIDDYNQLI